MKTTLALHRLAGCVGLASIGIVVMGMIFFGAARSEAEKHATPPNKSAYAALAEVPEKARMRKNPLEGDTQAVAAGGKLFEQHCAECHGRKAGGARKGPSLLGKEVRQATPGTLFWVVSNGVVRRGMPVWSKLPEAERWQIVGFLQSLNAQTLNAETTNTQVTSTDSH